MTNTRKQIDQMRTDGRFKIDAPLEEMIVAQYGVEPDPYEYSEQDLHEQIRKLIDRYNEGYGIHQWPAKRSKPWVRATTHADPLADTKGGNG